MEQKSERHYLGNGRVIYLKGGGSMIIGPQFGMNRIKIFPHKTKEGEVVFWLEKNQGNKGFQGNKNEKQYYSSNPSFQTHPPHPPQAQFKTFPNQMQNQQQPPSSQPLTSGNAWLDEDPGPIEEWDNTY